MLCFSSAIKVGVQKKWGRGKNFLCFLHLWCNVMAAVHCVWGVEL